MNEWIQIIIAAVGGGAITKAIERINLLRSSKRKGDADAERAELENDNIRFEAYVATINDLNQRLETALARMRELETAIANANAENITLRGSVKDLKERCSALESENSELKRKLGYETL